MFFNILKNPQPKTASLPYFVANVGPIWTHHSQSCHRSVCTQHWWFLVSVFEDIYFCFDPLIYDYMLPRWRCWRCYQSSIQTHLLPDSVHNPAGTVHNKLPKLSFRTNFRKQLLQQTFATNFRKILFSKLSQNHSYAPHSVLNLTSSHLVSCQWKNISIFFAISSFQCDGETLKMQKA